MNESDLIAEVEKHPILYDRSLSGFNKTKMRDDAWKEVHLTLNVSEAECKKRWRSLRDSFIKLQRTRGGRARWPYLHMLQFLLPHMETRKENQHTDESDLEDDIKERLQPEITLTVQDGPITFSKLSVDDEEASSTSQWYKKRRHSSNEEEHPQFSYQGNSDADELFLMSCASTLRRLSPRQNAIARIRIQQALFETEFGTNDHSFNVPITGYCEPK